MIAGDGKDRRWIVAVGLIELIVVVVPFAEVIDDVADVDQQVFETQLAFTRPEDGG